MEAAVPVGLTRIRQACQAGPFAYDGPMSEAIDSHSASIRDEFAHQAESFARSPTMSLAETLGVLIDLVPEDPEARWVEVACGPGLIARAMAPRAGSVVGLDLTSAMVDKARADAAAAGVENVSFEVGDATALDLPDDSFDGAITRFSLHHIPAPVRVLEEMKRVVKPGGHVVVADFVTDDDRRRRLAGTDRASARPVALGLADPVPDRGGERIASASSPISTASSPSRSITTSG